MAKEGSSVINSISALVDAETRNTSNSEDGLPQYEFLARNGTIAAEVPNQDISYVYPNGRYTQNGSFKKNGMATGVVLNSYVSPSSVSNNELSERNKDLELVQPSGKIPEQPKELDNKGQKTEMSLPRKIAFGFSFLPSITFVLAFSVFLPCQEPTQPDVCLKTTWQQFYIDKDLTTIFGSQDRVVIGISSNETNFIISLDSESGNELWNMSLSSNVSYINCKDVDVNKDGIPDCVFRIEDKLYAVNNSDGYVFWNTQVAGSGPPVFLSDCDKDGVQEIAVARKENLTILSNGAVFKELAIGSGRCSTPLEHLLAWTRKNSTDLLISCNDSKGDAIIWLIEQKEWCDKKENEEEYQKYHHFQGRSLKNWLLLPTSNGLLIWMEDTIVLCHKEAEEWRENTTRLTKNRFLLLGNFLHGAEIAYGGFDGQQQSQVTYRTLQDGNLTATKTLASGVELKQAIFIPGKNKDYLSVLLEKDGGITSFKTVGNLSWPESTEQPSFNFAGDTSTGGYTIPGTRKIKQTIDLLELEEKDSQVTIIDKGMFAENYVSLQESDRKPQISAYLQQKDSRSLHLILGRTTQLDGNISQMKTHLQSLKSDNWNEPLLKCKFAL